MCFISINIQNIFYQYLCDYDCFLWLLIVMIYLPLSFLFLGEMILFFCDLSDWRTALFVIWFAGNEIKPCYVWTRGLWEGVSVKTVIVSCSNCAYLLEFMENKYFEIFVEFNFNFLIFMVHSFDSWWSNVALNGKV